MMVAAIAYMTGSFGPVAESEDGGMLQIIIIAIVMIASTIGSVLKKRQEQSQGRKTPQPPAGSTAGTTVPSTRRVPWESRTPRPPTAPREEDAQDLRMDRLDQLEQQRRQRAGAIEREMLERAGQRRRESQAKVDQARAGAAAAQRISQAAQMAEQAAAARAAAPLSPEGVLYRVVPDAAAGRLLPMSDRLRVLLAEPSWRTAVIMAEILAPPVGMRDSHQQAGMSPPAMWA
jgi:hypothetical protein